MALKLGELLMQKNLLKKTQLDLALEEQRATGEFLGSLLVRKGLIRESDLLRVLSEQFHMPTADLKRQPIDWTVAMRFTPSVVVDHQCLPFKQDDNALTVAIVNPLDASAVSRVEEQAKGMTVKLVLVSASDMKEALVSYKEHNAERIKKLLGG